MQQGRVVILNEILLLIVIENMLSRIILNIFIFTCQLPFDENSAYQ